MASEGPVKITIEFDNEEAADHFMGWLWGQGEQDYWLWMEYREREEKTGNITARSFNQVEGRNYKAPCHRMDSR